MIDKDKIDLILGQTTDNPNLANYQYWLISTKGMSQEESYNYTKYMGKLLRTNGVSELNINEAYRLVATITCSKYAKNYQRHLLGDLELYCEYSGIKNESGCLLRFEKPRPTKKNPKYLTQEQMKAFVRGARDYREFALAILFLTTGIRLSELKNLDMGDVDLANAAIKVRHGKGDRDREVPLSDQCIEALKVYYSHHNLNHADTTEPLFKSERGNRWSEHAIQAAVERIWKNAGLKVKVTPHMLQHSFASHCVQNGCDIYSLKELLGHSNIAITQVYLRCNSSQLRLAFDRGCPKF